MTDSLHAPVLVLVDLEGRHPAEEAPAGGPGLELVSAARSLTDGEVVALALRRPAAAAAQAMARAGATRLLVADLGEAASLASPAADAVVAAVGAVAPAAVLVVSDFHGKEIAGRSALLLDSVGVADAVGLEVVDGGLHASKLVLSGSWTTRVRATGQSGRPPIIAVRPGVFDAVDDAGAEAVATEALEVGLAPESAAVRLVSREQEGAASGPALPEARTVVVGGRGVDGDFDLVRSLAGPLGAAVGATRVACDEGWIERSAQIGQTGETISPRLYIGLGVSGAVHHTSGIQGTETIVAVCDDSEAPIFEMADFGVVGDVTEVVPQLVDELARLKG